MTTTDTLITNLPQIITAIGVVVTAVGSILAAYWSYKSRQQSVSNAAEVQQIKMAVKAPVDKV